MKAAPRIDPQRRRLSLGVAPSGDSATEDQDRSGRLIGFFRASDLERHFAAAQRDGKRAVIIHSVTDERGTETSPFDVKDEVVLGLSRETAGDAVSVGDGLRLASSAEEVQELRAFAQAQGIYWACKKGKKPESPNQDSFAFMVVEDKFALYIVADGHGPVGHDVSNEARKMLLPLILNNPEVLRLLECPAEELVDAATVKAVIEQALAEAFCEVQQFLSQEQDKPDRRLDSSVSGTTCTVAFYLSATGSLSVAHVGDSRAVLGHSSDSGRTWRASALTEDHKPDLEKEKKRIESADPPGRVVFDGYFNHRVFAADGPYPGLNMSRALGDIIAHQKAGLTAEPDVATLDLRELLDGSKHESPQAALLMCSDGVWEFIQNQQALQMVTEAEPQTGVDNLARESWNLWMQDTDGAISDDITAILIYFNRHGGAP